MKPIEYRILSIFLALSFVWLALLGLCWLDEATKRSAGCDRPYGEGVVP
jgi:hypothetical protein